MRNEQIVKLFLISIFISNHVKATQGLLDTETPGIVYITPQKIEFKDIDSGNLEEIKAYNENTGSIDKSIEVNPEIIKMIFKNSESSNFEYNYIIKDLSINIQSDFIKNEIKGILITKQAYFANIIDNMNFNIKGNTDNSTFALIGLTNITNVDNQDNTFFFENKGKTNIDFSNIMIVGSIVYSTKDESTGGLFNNVDNGEITLGSDNTDNLIVSNNTFKSSKYLKIFSNNSNTSIFNINAENIIISGNSFIGNNGYIYTIHNKGKMNIKSNLTKISNNKFESNRTIAVIANSGTIDGILTFSTERDDGYLYIDNNYLISNTNAYLILNQMTVPSEQDSSSLTLDYSEIHIKNNQILSQINNGASLVYAAINTKTIIGTNKTQKIEIIENESNGSNAENSLFKLYSRLDINSNIIEIRDNIIPSSISISDENNDKFGVIFFNSYSDMNIVLHGKNPIFDISNNKINNTYLESADKLIGIVLFRNTGNTPTPTLTFINESDDIANINLGHDIRSLYKNGSSTSSVITNENGSNSGIITFKNGEDGKGAGDFKITLGKSLISANIINIKTNMDLTSELSNGSLSGKMLGVGSSPSLNIDDNKKLNIKVEFNGQSDKSLAGSYYILKNFINLSNQINKITINGVNEYDFSNIVTIGNRSYTGGYIYENNNLVVKLLFEKVENGKVDIKNLGISYRNYSGDTVKITDINNLPIIVSEDTMQTMFGVGSVFGYFNYKYLVDCANFDVSGNIQMDGGVLVTGDNAHVTFAANSNFNIDNSLENSVFAVIGSNIIKNDNSSDYLFEINGNIDLFIKNMVIIGNSLNVNENTKSSLFKTTSSSNVNIDSNKINITNNLLTRTFKLNDNGKDIKPAVIFFNDRANININLVGSSEDEGPVFNLSDNKIIDGTSIVKDSENDIIGFLLIRNGGANPSATLSFINKSKKTANIILEHSIRTFDLVSSSDINNTHASTNSTIRFKKENDDSGGIDLKLIGSTIIDTNDLCINTDLNLILEANSDSIGKIAGVPNGNRRKLYFSTDEANQPAIQGKLTIDIQKYPSIEGEYFILENIGNIGEVQNNTTIKSDKGEGSIFYKITNSNIESFLKTFTYDSENLKLILTKTSDNNELIFTSDNKIKYKNDGDPTETEIFYYDGSSIIIPTEFREVMFDSSTEKLKYSYFSGTGESTIIDYDLTISKTSGMLITGTNNKIHIDNGKNLIINGNDSSTFAMIGVNNDQDDYLFSNNNGNVEIKTKNIVFVGNKSNKGIINNSGQITFEGENIGIICNKSNNSTIINEQTMNINLNGNNPYFEISGNDNVEPGIVMKNSSEFNYTNNSKSVAKVILNTDIKSTGTNQSTINFRGNTFEVNNGLSEIKTNKINVETDVTFLFAIDGDSKNGKLIGIGVDPQLNISNGKKLHITIDGEKSRNIEFNKEYDILYGFNKNLINHLVDNNQLIIDDTLINYNGGLIGVIISNDRSNGIIKALFIGKQQTTVTESEPKVLLRSNRTPKIDHYSSINEEYVLGILENIIERDENIGALSDIVYHGVKKNLEEEDNETFSGIFSHILGQQNSKHSRESVLNDLKPEDPYLTTNSIRAIILNPVMSVINSRLNSSINVVDSSEILLAYVDESDKLYKNIIKNSGSSTDFEIYTKINYNYSNDFTYKSIHTIGLTLGTEYNFLNNKYKIGLAYTFNLGNLGEYFGHTISLYSKVNDITISSGFRNNFVDIVLNYGWFNTEVNKTNNYIKSLNINYKYNTGLISLATTFGHCFILPNNFGILIPKVLFGYNHIYRSSYRSNLNANIGGLHINIISPGLGLDYEVFLDIKNRLAIIAGINFKNDINLNGEINVDYNIFDSNHIFSYSNKYINNFNTELSLALKYNVGMNIELSTNSYISYSTNNYLNVGIGLEGRWGF